MIEVLERVHITFLTKNGLVRGKWVGGTRQRLGMVSGAGNIVSISPTQMGHVYQIFIV